MFVWHATKWRRVNAWREWDAFTGSTGKASALSDPPSKALAAIGSNARGMGPGGKRARVELCSLGCRWAGLVCRLHVRLRLVTEAD